MNEKIHTCPKCGEPYKFASMLVGDQSICPVCRAASEARIRANDKQRRDSCCDVWRKAGGNPPNIQF